jgi:hypothetical protein
MQGQSLGFHFASTPHPATGITMYALSNAKCMHLPPDTMYCAHSLASIRILYMPSGSQCRTPNARRTRLRPSHSLCHHLFPLLSLLQRIHVRVSFSISTAIFILIYSYYSLAEVIYEAFTLAAFLMLLIQFVASTSSSHTAESALERKDKTRLPIPLCCWRFRPTKPYFMYTLKWSVLQYTIVRPGSSLSSIPFFHH